MSWIDVMIIILSIIVVMWYIKELYGWYCNNQFKVYDYEDDTDVNDVIAKYRSDYIGQLVAEIMHILNFNLEEFDATNQLIITRTPADTTLVSLLEGEVEFVAEINWRRKKVYCTYKYENEFIESYHKDFAFGFKRNQISFSKLDKMLRQCVAEVQNLLNKVVGTSELILKGAQQIAAAKDRYSTEEIYKLLKRQLIKENVSPKLMTLLGAYIRRIASDEKKDSDK